MCCSVTEGSLDCISLDSERERNFEYLSINRISGGKNEIPILSTEVHLDIP